MTLSSFERQEQLARLIDQHQRVSIEWITQQFEISPATARRDLDTLVERGRVRRVHGGALAMQESPPEPPVVQRKSEQADEKQRIGMAAANLVDDGDTVLIGGGTTTLEAARNLRRCRNLTVITNSLLILNALADAHEITLIGLGGLLRRSEMSLVGHITEQDLAAVRADKVIMGIRAIDPGVGLTNDFSPETATDRVIFRMGRELIVVADHTKCGRVAAAFVAPVNAMHTLVTDKDTTPGFIAALEGQGIKVVVA
jgi:DeoR/GlpR family transcriptional regulator of sugar metabolism